MEALELYKEENRKMEEYKYACMAAVNEVKAVCFIPSRGGVVKYPAAVNKYPPPVAFAAPSAEAEPHPRCAGERFGKLTRLID